MKSFAKLESFCVARVNCLPLNKFYEIFSVNEELDVFLQNQGKQNSKLLLELERPEIREIISTSSPSLWARLTADAPEVVLKEKKNRIAFVKYLTRIYTRSTPFGLIAGVAMFDVGPKTIFCLEKNKNFFRRTRVDMEVLRNICLRLSKENDIKYTIRWFANNSAFSTKKYIRYVESAVAKFKKFQLSEVEISPVLSLILNEGKIGVQLNELVKKIIILDGEISIQEAVEFIDECIEAEVLVPEILPNITGEDPLRRLLTILKLENPWYFKLLSLHNNLVQIDSFCNYYYSDEKYKGVLGIVEDLIQEKVNLNALQIDVKLPVEFGGINEKVANDLIRSITVLYRFSSSNSDFLSVLRKKFVLRYDLERIPLVIALDEEYGIGFNDSCDNLPLIGGLPFFSNSSNTRNVPLRWVTLIREKLNVAHSLGHREIVLEEDDVNLLENLDDKNLPVNGFAMVKILGSSANSIDAGEYSIYVMGVSGASVGSILGRFCYLDDTLTSNVRKVISKEEEKEEDCIFAEIVHHPAGNLGNVVFRPLLRKYEVEYLGISGAKQSDVISINDIDLCVENEEFVLYSRKLGKRVIPCLSSAHNFNQKYNPPIYKFLGSLVNQKTVSISLPWSTEFLSEPFLPRITYRKLILSLAQWNIEERDLVLLKGSKDFVAEIIKIREKYNLPREVSIKDGDQILRFVLDNGLSLECFQSELKNRKFLTLYEVLDNLDNQWLSRDGDVFTHEFVVPFSIA